MAWTVVAGIIEWWADEGLRDIGRGRFAAARGRSAVGEATPAGTDVDAAARAFVAGREPWRLSQIALTAPEGDDVAAVVAWAGDATAVLAGDPPAQRVVGPNESWGDLGLRALLEPAALEELVPPPWAERFAVPAELVERDLALLPQLVSLGADRYDVAYDGDLGVVRSWAAVIDGAVAQRILLRAVTTFAQR